MANFVTNQALHLYVGKAVKELAAKQDPSEVLTDAGDIALRQVKESEDGPVTMLQLVYRNGDGNIVASDLMRVGGIEYVRSAKAEDLRIKLLKNTVKLADGVSLDDLRGAHVRLVVTLREFIGLEYSESYPIVVDVYISKTLADAGEEALYEAIAKELEASLKAFEGNKPFKVESSADGVVISQVAQKWVRGKLQADPINFDVHTSAVRDPDNLYEEYPWGTVTVEESGEYVSGDYRIADLERFSYGERGDVYREAAWPYNYEPTMLVQPKADEYQYGMLTIRHAYSGKAEDVQKSPRDIHVAASDADIETLKSAVEEAIKG